MGSGHVPLEKGHEDPIAQTGRGNKTWTGKNKGM